MLLCFTFHLNILRIFVDQQQLAKVPPEHWYLSMAMTCGNAKVQHWLYDESTMREEMIAEGHTDRYCHAVQAMISATTAFIQEFLDV